MKWKVMKDIFEDRRLIGFIVWDADRNTINCDDSMWSVIFKVNLFIIINS